MHHFRLLAVLAAFIFSLNGCGDKKKDPMSGKDALNEEDKQLLSYIDSVQRDSLEAIQNANLILPNGPGDFEAQASDKVQKMTQLLNSGCSVTKVNQDERFDRNWENKIQVTGARPCPINMLRTSSFSASSGVWSFQEIYSNNTPEYQDLDPLQKKSVSGSTKKVSVNGQTSIDGRIDYADFTIEGIGSIDAEIATSQRYNGNRGEGALALTMIVNNERKYVVEVSWNASMRAEYRVNGHEEDRKVVAELFSAFGLLEIVDRSGRMR